MHVVMLAERYLDDLETGTGLAQPQREELERRGHTVSVITAHRPDVSHRDEQILEVPALILPGAKRARISLPGLGRVDAILRQADVIQAFEPLALASWAAERASHLGVPSLYFHHPHQALTREALSLINRFQAVLVPLPSDPGVLSGQGITAPIYPVVYGFVPPPERALDPHQWHRLVGLDQSVPILLYAGPLTEQASVPLLVDAVRSIESPLHLVIGGQGPAVHQLEQHILTRGAARWAQIMPVTTLPHTQDVFGGVSLALSAGGDPHPTWLVEAAARGIPIVAVRTAETESIVRNRSTGILTLPTQTALTRAVTQLLHRPALRQRYGQAATAHAASFRIERSVDQLLDVYALLRRLRNIDG